MESTTRRSIARATCRALAVALVAAPLMGSGVAGAQVMLPVPPLPRIGLPLPAIGLPPPDAAPRREPGDVRRDGRRPRGEPGDRRWQRAPVSPVVVVLPALGWFTSPWPAPEPARVAPSVSLPVSEEPREPVGVQLERQPVVEPQPPPPGPVTLYVIRGCYAGNVPPERVALPPGCRPERVELMQR